jgi:hypothetical protein
MWLLRKFSERVGAEMTEPLWISMKMGLWNDNEANYENRPDQLAVWYTKKAPVYKVQFTRKNMVMAGSAFLP